MHGRDEPGAISAASGEAGTTVLGVNLTTVARYRLNLPFSERRLLLFVGDLAAGAVAVAAAYWVNGLL